MAAATCGSTDAQQVRDVDMNGTAGDPVATPNQSAAQHQEQLELPFPPRSSSDIRSSSDMCAAQACHSGTLPESATVQLAGEGGPRHDGVASRASSMSGLSSSSGALSGGSSGSGGGSGILSGGSGGSGFGGVLADGGSGGDGVLAGGGGGGEPAKGDGSGSSGVGGRGCSGGSSGLTELLMSLCPQPGSPCPEITPAHLRALQHVRGENLSAVWKIAMEKVGPWPSATPSYRQSFTPHLLGHLDTLIPADPHDTLQHILPEWCSSAGRRH